MCSAQSSVILYIPSCQIFLERSLSKSRRVSNNFSKQRKFTKIFSKAKEKYTLQRQIYVTFLKIGAPFSDFQKWRGRPHHSTLFVALFTKDLSNEVNFNKIKVVRSQNPNRPLVANINMSYLRNP